MRNVAVVGTGLIGTSIAMALQRQGINTYHIDRDPAVAAASARRCAGRVGTPGTPADLAVLAVPPAEVALALREHQARGLAHRYTDVAGVKAPVYRAAGEAGCDLASFVGGHPVAGSEQSGPEAADPNRLRDRPWVLTPEPGTGTPALAAAVELVHLCGARPVMMSAEDHDAALAATSHVPHVVASALAAGVLAASGDAAQLCGRGMRDTVRIAAGDVGLWTDILSSNAGQIGTALRSLVDELTELAASLATLTERPDEGAAAALADLLRRGVDGRALIEAAQPAPGLPIGRQPVASGSV
jgi:prephenate dehydrogenase